MRKDQVADVLQQLRAELTLVLNEQIEGLYLYGSQARGDARPDSDLDVLVVIRDDFQYFEMMERTGEIAARLSLQYDTVISLAFTSVEKYNSQKIPFLLNVRQEGIAI
ncbi:MAG: nucleotidyltransferase domain-containing protein [Chloroflexi bacterium]|nr:MAG: nucleotidyltransferase domain-containing protein [Chloroflexota bacterium]